MIKAYGVDEGGLNFYRFSAIEDPRAYLKGYHARMNAIPVDEAGLAQVVEEGKGLDYYDFSAIGDAVGFKNAYRQALDELPLDAEAKLALIGEVMVAYELNIEMGRALAEKHIKIVKLD